MTRADLARHFAERGFTRGAEIGVERGKFAEVLCKAIPGLVLIAVDAWESRPGYREHVTKELWQEIEQDARTRLRPYKVIVAKGYSAHIAPSVPDEHLDFIYVDAAHDEASVLSDLMAWVPKVRKGGIVSGHDWNLRGVRSAVESFAKHVNLTSDKSPSWWFTRA